MCYYQCSVHGLQWMLNFCSCFAVLHSLPRKRKSHSWVLVCHSLPDWLSSGNNLGDQRNVLFQTFYPQYIKRWQQICRFFRWHQKSWWMVPAVLKKGWFYNLTLSENLGKTTAAVINSYVMSALHNLVIHM